MNGKEATKISICTVFGRKDHIKLIVTDGIGHDELIQFLEALTEDLKTLIAECEGEIKDERVIWHTDKPLHAILINYPSGFTAIYAGSEQIPDLKKEMDDALQAIQSKVEAGANKQQAIGG